MLEKAGGGALGRGLVAQPGWTSRTVAFGGDCGAGTCAFPARRSRVEASDRAQALPSPHGPPDDSPAPVPLHQKKLLTRFRNGLKKLAGTMKTRHSVLVGTLGLLLLAATARAGIVIANSLDQPFAASIGLSASTWAGQAFFSGSYTALEAVHLNLYGGSDNGTFSVQLWDATGAGGTPGSVVATLASGLANPTTSDTENVVSITGLNVPMVKLTTYYVVVRPDAGSTLRWGYTDSESGQGFPSGFTYTVNEGLSWSSPDLNDPQRMMVEAVPEASTWVAGAFAGLALLGGVARRKWVTRKNTVAARD